MHRNVERLIGRLATDPMLLRRFEESPRALLAEMSSQGFELSVVECEALAATDPEAVRSFAGSLDRRLCKASLTSAPDGPAGPHPPSPKPEKE